jgi:hypothetical protein
MLDTDSSEQCGGVDADAEAVEVWVVQDCCAEIFYCARCVAAFFHVRELRIVQVCNEMGGESVWVLDGELVAFEGGVPVLWWKMDCGRGCLLLEGRSRV